MIYDCFLFFNEFKVLELRLEELDAVVDQFVLVEATRTHAGHSKPLYFTENQDLFRKYQHKIRTVIVRDMPEHFESAWDMENHHRNAILRGLDDARPDDLIVISDVDEIPRAQILGSFSGEFTALELDHFYYKLNCKNLTIKWVAPVMLRLRDLSTPQEARMMGRHYWETGVKVIPTAGWHFSFMQDAGGISHKLQVFAHQECNTPEFTDPAKITDKIKFGLDVFGRRDHYWCAVPLDDSFPAYLREHPERFEGLIYDFKAFHSARQDLIYSLQDGLADSPALLRKRESQLEGANSRIQEIGLMWAQATRWKRRLLGLLTMPIDWGVGLVLIMAELMARLVRVSRRRSAPVEAVRDKSRCSILIVTWEGKDLLAESLPALLEALKFEGGDHEIVVVDNGSTDGTEEFLRVNFPQVRVVRSERNLYFGGGNNLGLAEVKNDIVVLLNNDMIVHKDFLAPLLEPFGNAEVFAVASQVFLADRDARPEETGKTRASFNGSELEWRHETVLPADEEQRYVPVFWGHGGAVAVDRKKLMWLGGFDQLFDPFYVEDADISYGAWKVGWQCLLAVHSKVIHKHRSSTSRFGSQFISQIVQRNQYLFFWKNFTDIDKLAANARRTFRARIRRAGVPGIGIRVEAKALLGAVQRLPQAIRRRLQRAKYIARSDEHVLQLIGSPADDFVQFSQLEFAKGAFSEYLGEGWYELEGAEGERFRWMSSRASVFLRAPSGTAVLEIKGMVPPLSSYRVRPVILTVSCFGHQKHFELEEGRLKVEWEISPLPAGFPVELRLSLNQTIESETDRRELGLIVDTIGFAPPGRRRDGRSLMPRRMALSSPAPNAAAYAAGRNILMVCAYLPARGTHGGANMMFNLIRSLSKKHRITVLSFYEHEAELKNVAELSQYCDKLEVIYRGQTFDVPNVFGVKPPDVIHEFHHARMARLVRRYLATKEFDILQCEFLYTGHLAGLDPNIPAVLTNHEVLSLAYQQKYERLRWGDRGKVRALVSWMRMLNYEEEVLRRLASVVVLTPREAEFLKRLLPGVPVYSHAMGVDCEYFSPMPEQADTQTVVFVGNFRHSPNVSAALWLLRDIWPRVHEQNPGAQLYVVGPFPDERMKEFDGKKNVTLTGWAEDVRQYLARATVVVAPVFEGAGMRTKVLEAWAMQKPVVGTSDSFEGLASESGDAACIADDAAQFGERICDLLKNPELARSMGQQARRHVEANFSWDAFADVYDRIYSEIVDRKGTAQCGRLASSRVSDVASAEELQEQR